ncbi:hypothetical protein TNCV_2443561 [Trichonephila clavipes]|nr:hypothetical protein TNCV_2443561 [Trichonephila clavipes]
MFSAVILSSAIKGNHCPPLPVVQNDNGATMLTGILHSNDYEERQEFDVIKHPNEELQICSYLREPGLPVHTRRRHYRVMYTDYQRIAVEYICTDGILDYMASVSVLHRKPVEWPNLDTGLDVYNLTSLLTPKLKRFIKMVDHTDCPNEPPPYLPVV